MAVVAAIFGIHIFLLCLGVAVEAFRLQ
jgi:hypothetical protein